MSVHQFDNIVQTAVESVMATLAHSESIDHDGYANGNDDFALRTKNRHVVFVNKSSVQHVTVYLDKAEVSRRTSLNLCAGVNEVRCLQLPPAIDKDTLRVDVKNTQRSPVVTSINDVSYVTRPVTEEESDFQRNVKELQDTLEGFIQQRETVMAKLIRLQKQRAVLDSFADCFMQKTPRASENGERHPEQNDKTAEKDKESKWQSDAAGSVSANWPFDALGLRMQNGTDGCSLPVGLAAGAVGAAKVVECMSGFFELFDKQATLLDTSMQQARRNLEKLDADIRTLQTKLKELSYFRDERQQRELVLVVEASEAVAVELNLTYVVGRAKWTPRYDVRVYASDSLLKLFYYGVVQQSTGEDWQDAPLTLCTAQPAIGGSVPQLLIQKIGFKSKTTPPDTPFRPNATSNVARKSVRNLTRATTSVAHPQPQSHSTVPASTLAARPRSSRTTEDLERYVVSLPATANVRHSTALDEFSVSAYRDGLLNDTEPDPSTSAPCPPLRTSQLDSLFEEDAIEPNVRDQGSSLPVSSTFEVARTYTVPCNSSPVKVMIALIDLPATLDYEANPRRSPSAFLRASAKNTSPYALIAGVSNVYLNNQFVARSEIRTVMPQEVLVAHLGADPAIRIAYRPLFKTREGGNGGKTSTVTHKQVIDVRNAYDRPIHIRIADQVPLSNEEKIKVTILEPVIKHPEKYDRSKPVRLHQRTNIVEWELEVGARETKELVLKYAVEYPANEEVDYLAES